MGKKKFLAIAILLLLVIRPALAFTAPALPAYLNDRAGVFASQDAAGFDSALRQLEKGTAGVQFVVLVERAIPADTTLEEYTLAVAEKNKIGKAGKDNGVLLYVAIDDRKYRWEVGYGVESTLSAPVLGRLSRTYLVPKFREGDYAGGILAASAAVEGLLMNSTDPDIIALKSEPAGPDAVDSIIITAFFVFIGIFFISFLTGAARAGKKGRGKYYSDAASAIFLGSMLGRGGRSGGGFSGGGFSGGGGGFGGGGHSGGW